MYLNAMNSFLAVQLEALWKVHLKMIVFKWIFLLGYIRKDFNYQTDALSEWREPNFQWKKKIEFFHWKKFREIWKRMSVFTWMKRARVSINYINKMDLFIYISVDQTTKWKTEGFFSSFSFYFYRSTLAITCQNAIIRHFNSYESTIWIFIIQSYLSKSYFKLLSLLQVFIFSFNVAHVTEGHYV